VPQNDQAGSVASAIAAKILFAGLRGLQPPGKKIVAKARPDAPAFMIPQKNVTRNPNSCAAFDVSELSFSSE